MPPRAFHNIPDGTDPIKVQRIMEELGRGRMVSQVYMEARSPTRLPDGTLVDTRIVVVYHTRPADFKPRSRIEGLDYVR